MQTTHFWHQLHIRGTKVIVLSLLLGCIVANSNAQGYFGLTNNSGSDDKLVSYGFFLGAHTASYQLRYSPEFLNPANSATAAIHSIFPKFTPGFSLGFLGIMRFHDQVNLIFTPKIGFYEYKLDVNYFNSSGGYQSDELVNETTQVELPLVFKYRSMRFNNTRMFFVGGGSYLFNTKPPSDLALDDIVTIRNDFTVEAGIGFEIYFKYFKFAPEIRFSHGINNLYIPSDNSPDIKNAISSLRRKGISILLNFQ
uniref:type IX secretion/gliding motility protein PorT/SprT n=1 Tax=Algoriphagus sp. TaxID=1872435 RepID=UPI0040472550